jgi:hypothetical protein
MYPISMQGLLPKFYKYAGNKITLPLLTYNEWDCLGEDSPAMCFGFKSLISNKMIGPVRIVFTNGTIIEATYQNDVAHGLMRRIEENTVVVSLWIEGEKISYFEFDDEFIEINRHNRPDQELFGQLYPFMFSRDRNDKAMLERMLASPLTKVPHGIKYLHSQIQPLTIDLF